MGVKNLAKFLEKKLASNFQRERLKKGQTLVIDFSGFLFWLLDKYETEGN
jgi:hypothetical protein